MTTFEDKVKLNLDLEWRRWEAEEENARRLSGRAKTIFTLATASGIAFAYRIASDRDRLWDLCSACNFSIAALLIVMSIATLWGIPERWFFRIRYRALSMLLKCAPLSNWAGKKRGQLADAAAGRGVVSIGETGDLLLSPPHASYELKFSGNESPLAEVWESWTEGDLLVATTYKVRTAATRLYTLNLNEARKLAYAQALLLVAIFFGIVGTAMLPGGNHATTGAGDQEPGAASGTPSSAGGAGQAGN